jgi:hypothetical protein
VAVACLLPSLRCYVVLKPGAADLFARAANLFAGKE